MNNNNARNELNKNRSIIMIMITNMIMKIIMKKIIKEMKSTFRLVSWMTMKTGPWSRVRRYIVFMLIPCTSVLYNNVQSSNASDEFKYLLNFIISLINNNIVVIVFFFFLDCYFMGRTNLDRS